VNGGARWQYGLALLGPPVLVALLLLLSAEAFLRVQRFGSPALLQPLQFMAPGWRETDCFQTGPNGELMTPDCVTRYKGVDVATNSAGLNDREVDESGSHFRVVVLGDSVTMAAGVEARAIYHARLEDELNDELGSSDFVEFYNYGRGGRTTLDQLTDLQDAATRWDLDAALVAVTPGNVWANLLDPASCDPSSPDPILDAEQLRFHASRVQAENPISKLLAVGERVTGLWIFHVPRDFFRSLTKRLNSEPGDGQRLAALEGLAIEKFRRCAERMRALAEAASIDLAWVVLWYRPDRRAEIVRRELEALGEPVATMTGISQNYSSIEEMTIYANEVHPNAAVNADFARELRSWLGEQGWIAKIEGAKRQRSGEIIQARGEVER